jgi:hypothetical protein
MKYRIVKEHGSYGIEECAAKRGDTTWTWTYLPDTFALTYWGARYQLWRIIRRKAQKPVVVYCVEVRP